MTPIEFVRALMRTGIPENLPVREFDRMVGQRLGRDERQIRKYRTGGAPIPRIVELAIKGLMTE